jgi:hypothetical protein
MHQDTLEVGLIGSEEALQLLQAVLHLGSGIAQPMGWSTGRTEGVAIAVSLATRFTQAIEVTPSFMFSVIWKCRAVLRWQPKLSVA